MILDYYDILFLSRNNMIFEITLQSKINYLVVCNSGSNDLTRNSSMAHKNHVNSLFLPRNNIIKMKNKHTLTRLPVKMLTFRKDDLKIFMLFLLQIDVKIII